MRLAILGGTGDVGEGLALRFAYDSDHEIVIGSRDPERAQGKAAEYETELESRGVDRKLTGFANEMAADRADVVILAVPPAHVAAVIEEVAPRLDEDTIVVTPAVGMERDGGFFRYSPPESGSVAELVAATVPDPVRVVGAFHNLSADRLANLDLTFDLDTLIFGDDPDAKDVVAMLVEDVQGLRALDAGPLENAPVVEALTPLLVTLGMYNDAHDLGVKFQ